VIGGTAPRLMPRNAKSIVSCIRHQDSDSYVRPHHSREIYHLAIPRRTNFRNSLNDGEDRGSFWNGERPVWSPQLHKNVSCSRGDYCGLSLAEAWAGPVCTPTGTMMRA